MGENRDFLRMLPKVDEMLQDRRLLFFMQKTPRQVVVDAVREITGQARADILEGRRQTAVTREEIIAGVEARIREKEKKSLRHVVNATGVVLHTNLGRARLSERAMESVRETAGAYTNLEYDIKKGARGSRHDHVEQLIRKITGAEAAMVVNNNAAATMLCLSALTKGKEVIVSRGELVEIGGSFRIPEIMEESGSRLVEVGTTNKTNPNDYRNAFCEGETGAFLKVHTSNYRIVGFTREVTIAELAELKKECAIPVIYDMGSGLMADMRHYGLDEPTVGDALRDGADVVLFSGDKLLGGPQGGIIIGKKEYVDKMKKHPLARAFRVDKMTLAALEATFFEYQDMERAVEAVPALRMIAASREELHEKAQRLREYLKQQIPGVEFTTEDCDDQVGGGSAPTVILKGCAVTVNDEVLRAEQMERQLRKPEIPVIARVAHDKIWLSVRTIEEKEFELVARAFERAVGERASGRSSAKEKGGNRP